MLYIKWTMGYQPVNDNDRVDVLFSDGYESLDMPAKCFNWQFPGIIAYRKKGY